MKLPIYQIDAFAKNAFEGNPAAVCPLDEWLPDAIMQSIAEENNLSETAFFVKTDNNYRIRWFTPKSEIDLCGHATLAAAYVLFYHLNFPEDEIEFDSNSGELRVKKQEDMLMMDFPNQEPIPCEIPKAIEEAFSIQPVECLKGEDYLVVFETEADILSATPDLAKLSSLDLRGVIITAQSSQYDFVSRFFAPKLGINEDPVTGSAHTQLVPYWSRVLGSNTHKAKQLSKRGGELACELSENRVFISGYATLYLSGTIEI